MKYQVLNHSSIKFNLENKVVYFDPFEIKDDTKDADIIFITHNHFDHYSIKDIKKVSKKDTIFVMPLSMKNNDFKNVTYVKPNEEVLIDGILVNVIPSYNNTKSFHKKSDEFVGYILIIDNIKYYIMGDCDLNDDNKDLKVDYLFIPIGGTYTFDYKEAASYVNLTKPKVAIATHYTFFKEKGNPVKLFKDLVEKEIVVEK